MTSPQRATMAWCGFCWAATEHARRRGGRHLKTLVMVDCAAYRYRKAGLVN
jgi:hypothetical protein